MTTRYGSATVTLPDDTTIHITRSFEAPIDLVWEAITTPRHLLRWWGPSWCPLVACEVDLRPGGTWRYLARGEDGTELAWHGTYQEVEAPHRTVSTEVFEGFPDAESLNTTTLTHTDGVTTLETLVRHSSTEHRDGHLASGMEEGMQETFDRLDGLLDQANTAATEIDLGPPGRQTIEQAIGMIILGDVLVHTWDLARAAGLDDSIDETVAAEMLAGMEPMDEMLRSSGHYGPRVQVDDDADVVTRLIAFTGRDPHWSP